LGVATKITNEAVQGEDKHQENAIIGQGQVKLVK
jgi:hypothetical protein